MSSSNPKAAADPPAPVADFVQSINTGDLAALLDLFVDDAVVNDELVPYWGKARIRDWAERDIFGKKLALEVATSLVHHHHIILSARISGDFDRRGLPDPLVLTFYFSLAEGRIVQLIILPDPPGP